MVLSKMTKLGLGALGVVCVGAAAVVAQSRTGLAGDQPWELAGKAMTSCSCRTPCPCRVNLPPAPNPFCESVDFALFEGGRYGETPLTGTSFVLAQRVHGEDSWHVLYLPNQATRRQQEALLNLVKEVVCDHFDAVRLVPIHFQESKDGLTYEVSIPGTLKLRSHEIRKADGSSAAVRAIDVWGGLIAYAESEINQYSDKGLRLAWNWAGRQSNHKSVALRSEDYRKGGIGWKLYDGSGKLPEAMAGCSAHP